MASEGHSSYLSLPQLLSINFFCEFDFLFSLGKLKLMASSHGIVDSRSRNRDTHFCAAMFVGSVVDNDNTNVVGVVLSIKAEGT